VSEWKPIETAPRDQDFLVYLRNGYIARGRYVNGRHFAADSFGPSGARASDPTPTHWMPLPEPPR
jgi:hypothetical protein